MIVFLYLGLIVVAFFFLIVLPQRRRLAEHRALVASLEPGDEVITSGGVYGTIRSLDEHVVHLEVAEGVVVRVARNAIGARPPGADAGSEAGPEESADEATG
jgi:preprotein translocase subunit YajC